MSCCSSQVGRAGRFGTKGLAISFVTTQEDKDVMEAVEKRFGVSVTPLPETIDVNSYSEWKERERQR